MDSDMQHSTRARAIDWHIRLRDGDDAAWDAFAEWLAVDPSHADAYALIEQTDLAIEPLLPELLFREAANDAADDDGAADIGDSGHSPGRSRRWWVLGGGAMAASIAAAVMIAPQMASNRYEVVTAPGENQIVTLDPTTRITLNGATRMAFDRKDPRFAALLSGEALFVVRHDSSHPFTLEVGDDRIEDTGTVFNVVNESGAVRVAVSEGQVVYNPGRSQIALNAGQSIVAPAGSATVRVGQTPVDAVGAWQRGQLIYAGEPLSVVAADLSRSLGVAIRVAPAIADRPFHGTIALDSSGPAQLARLKIALNVELDAGADGWSMTPLYGER